MASVALSLRLLPLALLLVACPPKPLGATDGSPSDSGDPDSGDTDDTDTPPDPATVVLGGACEMAEDDGGFTVSAGVDEAEVDGSVADGVVPVSVLEEL